MCRYCLVRSVAVVSLTQLLVAFSVPLTETCRTQSKCEPCDDVSALITGSFLSVFDEFLGDEGKPPSPDELPYLLYPYVPEPRSDVTNRYPMPHWDLPWANAEANNDDEGPRMWDRFLQNPLLVKVGHLLRCNLTYC